jgi:molybdopterin/thiamine biosynthesis adenylyltransferase/molybdopterin converting factor small subunit
MTRALIIGVLGCPAALALSETAPEVRLVLVDPDRVERSNLARQILFSEADLGAPKASVAAIKLPNAEARVARFDSRMLEGIDVVLDGTDDFAFRFQINDLCVARGIPLVHGAATGWRGQLLSVANSACLRCLFEAPPGEADSCARSGVFAPLCGVVGAAMADAALAVLRGEARTNVLRTWDFATGRHREVRFARDPNCPACIQASPGESDMPVTVKIPAPLRPLTQNQAEVPLENAATVQAALEELSRKFPGIKDKLLDDKGGLRRYVNLFKNDEDVRAGQGLGTALKEGDRLTIVPAIAGGRC